MSYETLDNAIMTAICGGATKFYLINAKVEHLAKPHTLSGDGFRVVDRRLQNLSKRGLIQYWRGHWRMRERANAASLQPSKEKP